MQCWLTQIQYIERFIVLQLNNYVQYELKANLQEQIQFSKLQAKTRAEEQNMV